MTQLGCLSWMGSNERQLGGGRSCRTEKEGGWRAKERLGDREGEAKRKRREDQKLQRMRDGAEDKRTWRQKWGHEAELWGLRGYRRGQ